MICKFYLQGNCRYGENCKFQHQDGNRYSSILRQPQPQPVPQPQVQETNTDLNMLIRLVTQDANNAEKGNQWILSCYGPFKEKPNFPGFDDVSFEEMRYEFYKAKESGNIEQYKYSMDGAIQSTRSKLRQLQNPTGEIIEIIKKINSSNIQNSNPFEAFNQNLFTRSVEQSTPLFSTAPNPFNTNLGLNNDMNTMEVPQFDTISTPTFPATNSFPTQNLFAQTNQNQGPFQSSPQTPQINQSAYSRLEELSDEEIKQFQADVFEFGCIPEKPPNIEMCF